jgi:hypothetical protein
VAFLSTSLTAAGVAEAEAGGVDVLTVGDGNDAIDGTIVDDDATVVKS